MYCIECIMKIKHPKLMVSYFNCIYINNICHHLNNITDITNIMIINSGAAPGWLRGGGGKMAKCLAEQAKIMGGGELTDSSLQNANLLQILPHL